MDRAGHSRTPSVSTSSSSASYQLLLDHILSHPNNYDIPLRTMYTLNSTPRAQPLPHHWQSTATPTSSVASSPSSPQQMWQEQDAASETSDQFNSSLMAEISCLPSQPFSLPPSFITSFVRKCFTPDLTMVDFPQALTGLDYLKDLETRRRKEVASALSRLGIEREGLDNNLDGISTEYPRVKAWITTVEAQERKVEALYTQVYVALRRWILINELSLTPFSKHNCLAMLNTLYPPAITSPPTTKLTPTILNQQRDGWFRYIQGVERHGPQILANLMKQGAKPGHAHGWPAVCDTLDTYLRAANAIIDECSSVTDAASLSSHPYAQNNRKVDSGVSFNSTGIPELDGLARPSTVSSFSSGTDKGSDVLGIGVKSGGDGRPLPPHKPSSTIERLTRKFRNKLTVSGDAETAPSVTSTEGSEVAPGRQLRKTPSFSTIPEVKKPAPRPNRGFATSVGLGAMHVRTRNDILTEKDIWHEQLMEDWRRKIGR